MDADHRPDANEGRSAPERRDTSPTSDERAEGRRRRNRHQAFRRKSKPRYDGTSQKADAEAPTSAEMRAARASGRTPGISTADEPATVPLGTDEEAAGTPPSDAELQQEIDRTERGRGMRQLSADEAMKGRPGHPEESPRAFGKLVTIGAVVVILVLLAMLIF